MTIGAVADMHRCSSNGVAGMATETWNYCRNIMSMGVFMLLVASASTVNGTPDPVLHAMVLTGIVVAIAGTALALFLVAKIHTLDQASDKDGH